MRGKKPRANARRSNKSKTKPEYSAKKGAEAPEFEAKTNDPKWYASDPTLLRDAASIPFSWPTGATKIHETSVWSDCAHTPYADIPGIMSLLTVPAVGTAMRATDPINVAAQSVYSFVRHANSGHSNYDPCDLMLYILAMANFYSFLVWCQRSYGYALTYDQRNRYIPTELLRMNNIDADDVRANLANFRFWINQIIAKAASFAVPATMSIFSRMSFLYSSYYVEGTSIKDQLYQFVPEGFYQFGINPNTQLGQLKYVKIDRTSLMTTQDIMNYGDALFQAIWSQEDFGIMSGDILKAYGDNIIKVVSIPEAYTIVPSFDAEVLTQMKNAKLLDAEAGDIDQGSTGNLVQYIQPVTYTTSDKAIDGNAFSANIVAQMPRVRLADIKDNKVLTVDTDNPTPEVVIEATRLMYGWDSYYGEIRVGSEFIREIHVSYEPGYTVVKRQVDCAYSGSADPIYIAQHLEKFRSFHYCPKLLYLVNWNGTTISTAKPAEYFDIDNFAILDNNDINKMHAAATINMYAVPSVGKV